MNKIWFWVWLAITVLNIIDCAMGNPASWITQFATLGMVLTTTLELGYLNK